MHSEGQIQRQFNIREGTNVQQDQQAVCSLCYASSCETVGRRVDPALTRCPLIQRELSVVLPVTHLHSLAARTKVQRLSTAEPDRKTMTTTIEAETLKQYLADSPPTVVPLAIKPHFEALNDKEKLYAHHLSLWDRPP